MSPSKAEFKQSGPAGQARPAGDLRQHATELSGGAGWYEWSDQAGPLANISRWLGVFKAIQRAGDWTLAGEARYVAGRQRAATDTWAAAQVPANWTLRASVRRDWSWGWGQVVAEDLTDSRRQDLVAREYAPVTRMAGDGRALRGTLGVKF